MPPLYVRGDDTSELRAAIVSFWHPSRIARSPDPTDKLKALLDDDDAPLRNSYVHALCYGVLFAFYGRWSLTQLIAERAVRIARDIAASRESAPTALERISGREAYYLLAVALRVNAQTVDHFDEARAALKRARQQG